jgi:hypothetical protein
MKEFYIWLYCIGVISWIPISFIAMAVLGLATFGQTWRLFPKLNNALEIIKTRAGIKDLPGDY